MTIDRAGAAMRGVLKRKFAEVEEETTSYASSSPSSMSSSSSSSPPPPRPAPPPFSVEWESDGETPLPDAQDPAHTVRSILKKHRRTDGDGGRRATGVSFAAVTVFHFPRCQGFVSVPSHGGASLGMAWSHSARYRYTLEEHAASRQRSHRERLRERLREERLEDWRLKLITSGALDRGEADRLTVDQLPGGPGPLEAEVVPWAEVGGDGGGDAVGAWPLQPYSYRQRQALLRGAGVKHIDREEKRQLHALRLSREDCGCSCRGFCEPETCGCSLAGIRCQMDRSNFPCGCSQDSCGNSQGRSEFNPGRVRTHYLHTAMRLHLERRRPPDDQEGQREVPGPGGEDHLQGREDHQHQHHHGGGDSAPDDPPGDGCPFGFSAEEDGGLLFTSMPGGTTTTTTTPSTAFCLIPEPSEVEVVEESSSSSGGGDRMEASSSSSSAAQEAEAGGGAPITSTSDHHQARDTNNGTTHTAASLCTLSPFDSHPPPTADPTPTTEPPVLLQPIISSTGTPPPPVRPTTPTPGSPLRECRPGVESDADRTPSPSSSSSSSSTDYLNENANEATDFFSEASLEGFPHGALFSANYSTSSSTSSSSSYSYSSSSHGYVDLSVSSDSDLEFFDSDYPLHSAAAKGHGAPAGLRHLQVFSSCSLPQYPDTPDCSLLESLIGSSSEPITVAEDAHMVTYSQLLEVLQ